MLRVLELPDTPSAAVANSAQQQRRRTAAPLRGGMDCTLRGGLAPEPAHEHASPLPSVFSSGRPQSLPPRSTQDRVKRGIGTVPWVPSDIIQLGPPLRRFPRTTYLGHFVVVFVGHRPQSLANRAFAPCPQVKGHRGGAFHPRRRLRQPKPPQPPRCSCKFRSTAAFRRQRRVAASPHKRQRRRQPPARPQT